MRHSVKGKSVSIDALAAQLADAGYEKKESALFTAYTKHIGEGDIYVEFLLYDGGERTKCAIFDESNNVYIELDGNRNITLAEKTAVDFCDFLEHHGFINDSEDDDDECYVRCDY